MDEFDLDLRSVEEMIDEREEGDDPQVVLGALDGSTDPREWIELVGAGNVLVLAVDGDLNELAAGFAGKIKEGGGQIVHFRGFLIVAPKTVGVDTSRLG